MNICLKDVLLNIKCFLTIIVLFYVQNISAQVDSKLEHLRTVIPPSPNASSLAKYGEWPVSLYTGVPSINIPIYELKGRNINLPISISYHAAGNKVGEIASWVGLGWSLNAGGVITRSVRGLPDEFNYFSNNSNYSNPNDFCSTPINNTSGEVHTVQTANGNADGQMDMYSFSALGKSYSLIIAADGIVYTKPFSKIKITTPFFNGETTWNVTLEDGTKLIFGGDNNHTETNTDNIFGVEPQTFAVPYVSSWYLKSLLHHMVKRLI